MSVLSDPPAFRKTVAGISLIGFPLAAFVSCLTDSAEGTGDSGAQLYGYVTANAAGIRTTGLVFMLSAVLTVPAALGLAHLLRRRGVVLGHLGATALAVGAFGHFAYGFWQVLVARAAGLGDQPGALTYLGRTSAQTLLLLPELFLVDIGVLLLSIGLVRARVVPAWAPWLTIAGVAADVAVQFTGITATWPVTALWGLLTVAWGALGVHVLRMPAAAWAADEPAAAPEPVAVG